MGQYIKIMKNDELQHFGILGMHWGVRKEEKKLSGGSNTIKKKINSKKVEINKERMAKYQGRGYTKKQAEILSEGERRTKKALLIAGGVVLTAGVAFAAYKYHDFAKDSLIKANAAFQTVHKEDIASRLNDPFFASFKKKDNVIYSSKVFSHFTDESQITKMFTKDGIKIASHKSGQKAFSELMKNDDEFKKAALTIVEPHMPFGQPVDSQKFVRRAYKEFSTTLVRRTGGADGFDHDSFHKIFYNKLAEKGYGGVIDINDSLVEGFTHKPTIIFDATKKHIVSTTKATVEDLGDEKMLKGMLYSGQRLTVSNPNNIIVKASALIGANSLGNHLLNIDRITDYKVEHPTSKMTDKQILKTVLAIEKSNR